MSFATEIRDLRLVLKDSGACDLGTREAAAYVGRHDSLRDAIVAARDAYVMGNINDFGGGYYRSLLKRLKVEGAELDFQVLIGAATLAPYHAIPLIQARRARAALADPDILVGLILERAARIRKRNAASRIRPVGRLGARRLVAARGRRARR